MSVQDRIESLKVKHEQLEHKISAEELRPQPDDDLIHTLKRQKLKLKDEITTLSVN
ncbi:YdcH family protein [Terasakiella pusilla]|jgi:hypothetical protein|uniref:YdcH family protein n=1 Tax=Terasakiella pusilla TaxID=64973 RepID=UPI000A02201D|nr:YdcH family protein [Terasakiella pusilla]